MGIDKGVVKPRSALTKWFRCDQCPEEWRPWREGGDATAEKHAFINHGGPFRGVFEDRPRQQWKPGDGRGLD